MATRWWYLVCATFPEGNFFFFPLFKHRQLFLRALEGGVAELWAAFSGAGEKCVWQEGNDSFVTALKSWEVLGHHWDRMSAQFRLWCWDLWAEESENKDSGPGSEHLRTTFCSRLGGQMGELLLSAFPRPTVFPRDLLLALFGKPWRGAGGVDWALAGFFSSCYVFAQLSLEICVVHSHTKLCEYTSCLVIIMCYYIKAHDTVTANLRAFLGSE